MSIQISTESHLPHITGRVITVQTKYIMDINDFYNGYGVATTCAEQTIENPNLILPSIGTKFIQYHYLSNLTGTYWDDVVLGDITTEKTTARNASWVDTSGWDLNKKVLVTYTWSNASGKDIIVPGDQSSLEIDIKTSLESEDSPYIIDVDTGDAERVAWKYFNMYNPDIILDDPDDSESTINYGPFRLPDGLVAPTYDPYVANDNDKIVRLQNDWIEAKPLPAREKYKGKTILSIKGYSKYNLSYGLSENINTINDQDFLLTPYEKRETRLQLKGKLPTDNGNDLITLDDTARWRFYDYEKTEFGIDGYAYTLFFEYRPERWDRLLKQYPAPTLPATTGPGDATAIAANVINEYKSIDFYSILLTPLFNTGI